MENKKEKTEWVKTLLWLSLIVLIFVIGYQIGNVVGWFQGVIDASTVYRLDNIETILNISKNVSDNIILEVSIN